MAKRGNGEGSIRRRKDGRCEGRYTDASGQQRSVYWKARKETAKKLAEAQREGHSEVRSVRMTMTVREVFAEYDGVARGTMKRRGYETYHDVARLHVLPEIGSKKRLTDLSRWGVRCWPRQWPSPAILFASSALTSSEITPRLARSFICWMRTSWS